MSHIMIEHAHINAAKRQEIGRKTNLLREEGKVPAVMYGFETEPVNLVFDRNAFNKVYALAGESMVIDVEVDGQKHPVLITEVQRNPLTGFASHVDFRRIDLSRKIETGIPLKLVGESVAVKGLGGTLVQSLEEIEVSSLPDALVHEIEVDISALNTFDDIIRVKDIKVPEGIEVITHLEQAVASVQPPRTEEEMAELNAAVDADVSKVEVLKEKKDEPVEGEAAGEAKKEPKKEAKKEDKK